MRGEREREREREIKWRKMSLITACNRARGKEANKVAVVMGEKKKERKEAQAAVVCLACEKIREGVINGLV